MRSVVLYRIASGLLVIFAAGHTFGFLRFKPPTAEGIAVRDAMNQVSFSVGGKRFRYGDFYVGFGLFVSAYLVFAAFLAWRLGDLANRMPEAIGSLGWAFFAVQLATLVLSWIYFFPITVAFSALVVICLGWATWLVR